MGSFHLGLHARGCGDVDICIVGSDKESASDFLVSFSKKISENVTCLQLVLGALVPVLKFQIGKTKVDIVYGGIPSDLLKDISITELSQLIPKDVFCKLSQDSIQAINGVRDAEYLKSIIPDFKSFSIANHFLRAWAIRRGIYSNAQAYLGGYSWRILLVLAALDVPKASPEEIIILFFSKFSVDPVWDIKKPLSINESTKSLFRGRSWSTPYDYMIVLSPFEPVKNTARNVCKSTFHLILSEIKRANGILKDKGSFKNVYEKVDFFNLYPTYVMIEIFADSKSSLKEWQSLIESRIKALIQGLEKVPNCSAVPFPFGFPEKNKITFYLGIQWRDGKESEFTFVLHDFIHKLNTWESKTEEMYVLICQKKPHEISHKI